LTVLESFQPFSNTTRTGVRVAAKPTDGGNPGFVEKVDLLLSSGPRGGVTSHRIRLANYNGTLVPTVVDRVFEAALYDGIFLG
jgi:hypothetical protein